MIYCGWTGTSPVDGQRLRDPVRHESTETQRVATRRKKLNAVQSGSKGKQLKSTPHLPPIQQNISFNKGLIVTLQQVQAMALFQIAPR